MVVLTACVGLFVGVIDPKDFKDALLMVLAFYFGRGTVAITNPQTNETLADEQNSKLG